MLLLVVSANCFFFPPVKHGQTHSIDSTSDNILVKENATYMYVKHVIKKPNRPLTWHLPVCVYQNAVNAIIMPTVQMLYCPTLAKGSKWQNLHFLYKRAKCVCHFHWRQWNIMMSYLTYLLAGWVFMHKIWPGRRAH